jgi:dienelactone hydrolase
MIKQQHFFSSHQSRCEADLFLPEATPKPPVVVLAQGYAAERGFGTKGIISALVDAGIAVFAFDYRGFGGSELVRNSPRQLVDPRRQLEDWQAALGYVSGLSCIDAARMGLWGSSFAGGHVITVAGSDWSKRFHIKAVVSQIPHCDSRSAFKQVGLQKAMTGAWHGIKGAVYARFGKTHTVPIVGYPDDKHFSVMQHAGWSDAYLAMTREAPNWKNAVPAQSLLTASSYNPIDYASHIDTPVLIVYGAKDQGIPVADVEATAKLIRHADTYCFDGDHFDVYDGGFFQPEAVKKEVDFFKKYLG